MGYSRTTSGDNTIELICARCKEFKPLDAFSAAPRNIKRHGRQSYCRQCMSAYRHTIPKDIRNTRGKLSRDKYKDTPEKRLRTLLGANTVDRSALDFEWAWDKLKAQDFRCAVTGQPFEYTSRSPHGLSIDRINPELGYTKENVRFVCWWLNAAMGNWGLEKLKELIKDL